MAATGVNGLAPHLRACTTRSCSTPSHSVDLCDLLEMSMQWNGRSDSCMSRKQPAGSNGEPDVFERACDVDDDEPLERAEPVKRSA